MTPSQHSTATRSLLTATALLLGVAALQAGSPLETKRLKSGTPKANCTNTFTIEGMHCNGCANGIASELRRTPGVAKATVTLTNTTAIVSFDTNRVSGVALVKVIEEAGYKAKPAP